MPNERQLVFKKLLTDFVTRTFGYSFKEKLLHPALFDEDVLIFLMDFDVTFKSKYEKEYEEALQDVEELKDEVNSLEDCNSDLESKVERLKDVIEKQREEIDKLSRDLSEEEVSNGRAG